MPKRGQGNAWSPALKQRPPLRNERHPESERFDRLMLVGIYMESNYRESLAFSSEVETAHLLSSQREGREGSDDDLLPKPSEEKRESREKLVRAASQPEGETAAREETKIRRFLTEISQKRKSRLGGDNYRQWGSAPSSPNNSVLDLTWDEDEARFVTKKKEADGNPIVSKGWEQKGSEGLATKIRKTLKAIEREVRNVAEAAKERNTKKEIKESASSLRSLFSVIMTEDAQQLFQTLGKTDGSKDERGPVPQENLSIRLAEVERRLNRLESENAALRQENARLNEELSNNNPLHEEVTSLERVSSLKK